MLVRLILKHKRYVSILKNSLHCSYCMDHEIHCLGLPCPNTYLPPEMPCTIRYWLRKDTQKYNPFLLRPSRETCAVEIEKAIGKFQKLPLSTAAFSEMRI